MPTKFGFSFMSDSLSDKNVGYAWAHDKGLATSTTGKKLAGR